MFLLRSCNRSRHTQTLIAITLALGIAGLWYWIDYSSASLEKRSKFANSLNEDGIQFSSDTKRGRGAFNNKTGVRLQACVHPTLELWHPALKKYFTDVPALKCADEANWVEVINGTLRISDTAKKNHKDIQCEYTPVLRGKDDFEVKEGRAMKDLKEGDPIPSDFFIANCRSADKSTYSNIHAGISPNLPGSKATNPHTAPQTGSILNVVMIGFDSMSRMTYMRNLPKTHDYFVRDLGGTVLEGYNIVGDGTPQALLPILTGKTEWELPEARRGKKNAKPVNGHPWVWKDYAQAGFVTQFAEDAPGIGTFTYRMLGFKDQPVDHYMRPFYLRAERLFRHHKHLCLGSVPRHQVMFNYIRDLFMMYPNRPKWSFVFNSELTHGSYSTVRVADDHLRDFLHMMKDNGYLNETLLILMSDHGARFKAVRQTVQGKYEERMPYFALRFPPWFKQKYPQAAKNLKLNSKRLSSPFDIHETLMHLLNYRWSKLEDVKQRGMSLLNEIPIERSCGHADIEAHWCACLNWNPTPVDDQNVKAAAVAFIQKVNSLTQPERQLCTELRLKSIKSAFTYIPNDNLLHFKQSKDSDGRVADLSDDMKISEKLLQLTLVTEPGEGMFEVTVKFNVKSQSFSVSDHDISRINKYGHAPDCVARRLPHLRQYCYCK